LRIDLIPTPGVLKSASWCGVAIASRNCAMYPGITTAASSAKVLVQASTGIAVPLA